MRARPGDLADIIRRDGVLREVFDHARRAYPLECCGLIHSSGAVRRCVNAADEFHAIDPESFPRTAANGFALGFEDLRHLSESMTREDPVVAVYHSHPDAAPDFSAADRATAMPDGRAAYPELAHLIVSARGGEIACAKLYQFVDGDYREIAAFAP